MAFDYKKAYKDLYLPPRQPHILDVPPMNFLAVRGTGDPNAEGGAYQAALGLLYGVAFTIKMSKLGSHAIEGYFDYVVPPLEGLWWQEGRTGLDLRHKEALSWISLLRLPEFVTREVFQWAVQEASAKRARISPRWSSSPMPKGCACNACTWVPTTAKVKPCKPWTPMPPPRAMPWTSAPPAFTMRSIWAIPGGASRKTSKPCCGTPYEN